MNKKQLFDFISEKQDIINNYESSFGNDSWWYSNRTPETCNRVKIYASVDTDKVLELLSEKQRKQIELLDINIISLCNDIAWGDEYDFDYSIIGQCRTDYIDKLKELYPVVEDVTFHGRNCGWACVRYNFNISSNDGWTIDDIINNGVDGSEYKTLLQVYKQINKALDTVDKVDEFISQSVKEVCDTIEDTKTYIYDIEQNIDNAIDNLNCKEQEAKTILQALHVINNTYA